MADALNLLLIEDDLAVGTKIRYTLKHEGHTVFLARTFIEAEAQLLLRKETGTPFDAILCDFWLEGGGIKTTPGSETYKAIREIAGPEVPLLCASSDIPMWERIKDTEEDERMFTCKKVRDFERDSRLSYWDEKWVKATLATVKDLPPLSKKLPGILLASKDSTFIQGTTSALEEAGYLVTVVDNAMAAAEHLLPLGGVKTKIVAAISDFELAKYSGAEVFNIANMKKTPFPLLATGENLEKWAPVQKIAEELGLTLHLTPRDPALFLTKLKELGL